MYVVSLPNEMEEPFKCSALDVHSQMTMSETESLTQSPHICACGAE